MRLGSLTLLATLAGLVASVPSAPAEAPGNGFGFGVTDTDDFVAEAMGYRFAALEPKTFRFIVPYDGALHADIVARTAERIRLARAAGVEEIAVSFGPRAGDAPESGFHRPSAAEWIALVRLFIDRFDAEVDVWGPANEPNAGVGWLAGAHSDGPEKLAAYSHELERELEWRGGEDELLSPEFHDEYTADGGVSRSGTAQLHGAADPRSNVRHYLDHYRAAGGSFGDYVGWHPYSGVRRLSAASTEDLLASTPAHLPVWISEVGAILSAPRLGIAIDLDAQDAQVSFIIERLARLPRVARVSYWHMTNLTPGWDSALTEADGTPRPAWYTWCAAAHRDSDPRACGDRTPPTAPASGLMRGVPRAPWSLG